MKVDEPNNSLAPNRDQSILNPAPQVPKCTGKKKVDPKKRKKQQTSANLKRKDFKDDVSYQKFLKYRRIMSKQVKLTKDNLTRLSKAHKKLKASHRVCERFREEEKNDAKVANLRYILSKIRKKIFQL